MPPSEVIVAPEIMSGQPVVAGTRIPAATILAYVNGGYSVNDIREDYPSLPPDGIDAVIRWAARQTI